MNDTALRSLNDILWPEDQQPPDRQVHWLLDGARDPDIASLVRSSGLEYVSLLSGQLHPRLEAAAPYLVHLPQASPAAQQLLRRGWGNAWGVLTVAEAGLTLSQQRLHLKKFLRVTTEQGKILAFRYYDPRVLKVYLPTCTDEEFLAFLGPITRLLAESDDGCQVQAFDLHRDAMRLQVHPL